ncbi:MAG: hypothetical protein QXP97_06060 [Desulfurococcus sp.]|uniref:hypothetical protein n=1 Tax=Desulfurococcus sp. TaxID=51678 RepID=UPI003166EACE
MVRNRRAVSEIIAGVILFAVIITISLSAFFYIMAYIDQMKASTEYGYIKTLFTRLAYNIENFMNDMKLEYVYPHEVSAIGFTYSNVNISLLITDSTGSKSIKLMDGCYELVGATRRSLIPTSEPRIITGLNTSLVDDIYKIPLVYEYYNNGETRIAFNLCRVFYIFRLENASGQFIDTQLTLILFNITSIDNIALPPKVTGQGYLFISRSQNDDITSIFSNVTSVIIEIDKDKLDLLKQVGAQNITSLKILIKPIRILIG